MERVDYRVKGKGFAWSDWETAAEMYRKLKAQGETGLVIEEQSVYVGDLSQAELEYRFALDARDAE